MSTGRPSGLAAILAAVALTLLTILVYVTVGRTPVMRSVEAQTLDWRFALRGAIAPGPETVLLTIDDRSMVSLGRWPMPRHLLAMAVAALAEDGARVIAFDLLFTEPEPSVPAEGEVSILAARELLVAQVPALAPRIDALLAIEDPDEALATAIADAGSVILPYAFRFAAADVSGTEMPEAVARSAYRLSRVPAGYRPALAEPAGVLAPLPTLAEAAATAHVNLVLDDDGSARYEHPVIAYRDGFFPSLPIEAVRLYLGLDRDEVTLRLGDSVMIGDRLVPTASRMRLPVNHYGPAGSFENHSLVDLIEGRIPAGTFTDRIVVIGASAVGVGNTFMTPYTRTLAGAEHHATVIDNILHDRFIVQRAWTIVLDVLAIVVAGLGAAFLTARLAPMPARFAVTGLLGLWCLVAFTAFAWFGVWLTFLYPVLAIALNVGWFTLTGAIAERRSRTVAERQRGNLARYVPQSVADSLADSDRPFALDRTQDAAVMFVDIVGFTALSEGLSPQDSMTLLRDFLARVEQAVFAEGGTLDKFQGDGAMASFGVPEPGPQDAIGALKASRALADDVAAWNRERAAAALPPVRIGIGLHFGQVLVGALGGTRQFQFTVAGDTVNVASRLEAFTRTCGATIAASDTIVDAARAAGGDPALDGFVALPDQTLRGRAQPITIWAWPAPDRAVSDAA